MDLKLFATVFGTVFLAELGDKTQLATLLYASDAQSPKWTVFFAASAALIATSALGVLLGGVVGRYVPELWLKWVAGLGFIAVGAWTLIKG